MYCDSAVSFFLFSLVKLDLWFLYLTLNSLAQHTYFHWWQWSYTQHTWPCTHRGEHNLIYNCMGVTFLFLFI